MKKKITEVMAQRRSTVATRLPQPFHRQALFWRAVIAVTLW